MNTAIFGRSKEIKILDRLYQSKKPEFLAVYGRRRVGKTFLIHEYFKDKGIYFSITGSINSSKKMQLKKFFREFLHVFPFMADAKEPKEWDDAFYLLKEAVVKIDPAKNMTQLYAIIFRKWYK